MSSPDCSSSHTNGIGSVQSRPPWMSGTFGGVEPSFAPTVMASATEPDKVSPSFLELLRENRIRVSPLHRSLSSLEKTREKPEAQERELSTLNSLSESVVVFLAQPRALCVPTPTSLRIGMTERVMPGTSRWERVCFGGSPNLAWTHARSRQRRTVSARVGNEADQTQTS